QRWQDLRAKSSFIGALPEEGMRSGTQCRGEVANFAYRDLRTGEHLSVPQKQHRPPGFEEPVDSPPIGISVERSGVVFGRLGFEDSGQSYESEIHPPDELVVAERHLPFDLNARLAGTPLDSALQPAFGWAIVPQSLLGELPGYSDSVPPRGGKALHQGVESRRRCEVSSQRIVDGALRVSGMEDGGEVNQRQCRSCHRYALEDDDLIERQVLLEMHDRQITTP